MKDFLGGTAVGMVVAISLIVLFIMGCCCCFSVSSVAILNI